MSSKLSVSYYTIYDLSEKDALDYVCDKIYELLSSNHLKIIENAFIKNTRVGSNGLIYLRIKGIANILRTGSSGAERYFVYQGVDGVIAPAEIISIDGEEYISGPTLMALLDYRISSSRGKKKMYLKYSKDIYEYIRELNDVINIREINIDSIENNRKYLKEKRIKEYNISYCEFSDIKFYRKSEVEFAHIESVITSPHLAQDIDNGVIILKHIHAELTRRQIHDYRGMFEFCIENGYSTYWAK
ncbi:hypothetical protein [Clostridium estertheticum]|uniref:Uncharacterized protein n=1 Tax=Clostridium estertheticum subsp. estertheticum TaxID=1552 RepID=A0A1J0GCA2_9CLOT|nr:hypothetical protein [Clostridium estertheticum]APC38899.1 hypothetical protein A7L45_01855 [Clostridium estertheticum subsp. estertheticum]MBZ9615154.1 hypothetical protein [Clostridium estertheticum subsp. laramiense]WAG75049.1 hypothetical protein LL032_06250 [Clostridium estertheticum]